MRWTEIEERRGEEVVLMDEKEGGCGASTGLHDFLYLLFIFLFFLHSTYSHSHSHVLYLSISYPLFSVG